MKKSILIFIISHHASFRLLDLYKKIPFVELQNYNVKTLISDDSSTDDTWEIAKKIKEENET